jgi:hypothetical protein
MPAQHAAAEKLAPLSQRLMQLVAESEIVQADETSLVMQKPFRRDFVWTFLTDEVITYRFAPDRSGETPRSRPAALPASVILRLRNEIRNRAAATTGGITASADLIRISRTGRNVVRDSGQEAAAAVVVRGHL